MLDACNHGDTSGAREDPAGSAASPSNGVYSGEERRQILQLARRTVRAAAASGQRPDIRPAALAAKLSEPKGCFVTLTETGRLRGCIGHLFAEEPLFQAVVNSAFSAALQDARFAPVTPAEVDLLEIEVSVLSAPEPLEFQSPEDLLARLQPHQDGVVLNLRGHSATYLPQVWEQLPDKVKFLESLSQKAGCAAGAWRDSDTTVLIYHVEAFKESELR